eukprot:1157316-Pelagomonas_calceolata.AAC.1
MKTAAYSSSCGLHILRLHARSQSKHLLLNVRPCSSTVEVPTTLPGSTTSTHLHSAGNKKQPLQLSLGPLPLVEQRFRVSRRRYQPPSSSPPGSARNGGSVPAASGKQQQQQEQHQQQSKYHPEEFVLLAPDDVDEVIDLYFERLVEMSSTGASSQEKQVVNEGESHWIASMQRKATLHLSEPKTNPLFNIGYGII